MSFPNDRTYTFDANNVLSDNAAAYAASGYLQAGGADGVVDLGGNQGTSPAQQARIDAMAVFDVTAITVSGTQTYQIDIVVSNDPAFLTGNVAAGGVQLGKGTSLRVSGAGDSVIGRYELGFTNQVAGTIYQFVKAYLTAANTPSISISAFIVVLPEP